MTIGFTPECAGVENKWRDVAQDMIEREDALYVIFAAIDERAANKQNRKIRRLNIINLQNDPLPDFTTSDVFRKVIGDLEELHLSIVRETNERNPHRDWSCIELQTFPAHLCSNWLKPISKNLKQLAIYNRPDNWGPL